MVSHMKLVTAEQIEEIRDANPGLGSLDCKRLAQKTNALEAIEEARFCPDPWKQLHTVLDVLQYIVERG